jgi:hypothetical protein
MKSKFTLVAVLLVAFFAVNAQQLNNAGFETWTSPNNPDSWATWESTTGVPLGLVKKDTATKVEGTASIQIKTDSVQAGPNKLLIAGFAFYGTTSYAPPAPVSFVDAAFAYKPDTLWFAYKYTPAGADSAYLEISASGPTGNPVAGGLPLLNTQGQWNLIYIPLTGNLASLPTVDSLSLLFSSSIGRGKQGSVLNVDAIRFGYVSAPCSAPSIPTSATASSSTITQGQSTTLSVNGGNVGDGQWVWYTGSCGGTQIGTGSSLSVTPNGTTTFYVRGEGCGSNTNCVQVTVNVTPVGINEVAENINVTVFPNPASDVINVASEKNLAGFNFQIMDVTGRVVSTTTLTGETTSVFVADLAKGNYIYKITDKNNGLVKQNKFAIVK